MSKIFKLSPKTASRLIKVRTEMDRIYDLPDRFLGRILLRLARQAREDAPKELGVAGAAGYENLIIWQVIPKLAGLLGEKSLTRLETIGALKTHQTGENFRELVGTCLGYSNLHGLAREKDSMALFLLSNDFVNGNPITMALDRVAPPDLEAKDWVARHMREISQVRFGHPFFDRWDPEFQKFDSVLNDSEILTTFPPVSPLGGPDM
jgi:hypothetical protein